jgi:hypothetical protein
VQFVFRYIPSSWRSLRVGFLASVRNDIYIGSSSISISAITSVTNNLLSSSIVKTVEIGAIDSFQGAVGRAYLNGFALNSNSKAIQVQVEAKAVLQTGLSVAVYTGPETDLRSVVFSYLVFNPSRLPFLAYGGSVVKLRFSGDSYQDVRNTNNLPAPFMAGIVKLGSSLTLNLESSVDNDFVFQTRVQGASADFVYSYAAFGVNTQSICTSAENRHIYYESCVKECPANSFLFTLRDGALQCRSCSAKLNMVVNA